MKYVLDTHALIWYIEGNNRLGSAAKVVMDDIASEMILPIIALIEATLLVEKQRTRIPDVATLLDRIYHDPRIQVASLDDSVFQQSLTTSTIPEIHDRLIVATALYLKSQGEYVSLLTRDSVITASGLIPVTW